jgi:hypothetical protein
MEGCRASTFRSITTRSLLLVLVTLSLLPTVTAGISAFSPTAFLKPFEDATDPNPVASVAELEETATLEEIDAVMNVVVGTEGGIIIQRFRPHPDWLWKQWFGTVLFHASTTALKNMSLALAFCIVTRSVTQGDFQIFAIPDESFYPRLQAVDKIWKTLMSLTTFLLTFFVGQAYSFWRSFHDQGRGIQGRLNDINMLMATSAARDRGNRCYTPESLEFLECVAKKLRIFHLLFWASNARRFRVLLTQTGLERMVQVGYLPREEKERLDGLDLPATQKWAAVMESALMDCQEGMRNKKIVKHPGNIALEQVVLDQFCRLRGLCATIPDLQDGRMPLAYAHFVQILVDSFLVFAPVAQ